MIIQRAGSKVVNQLYYGEQTAMYYFDLTKNDL